MHVQYTIMMRLLAAIALLAGTSTRCPDHLAVAFSPDGKLLASHGYGPLLLSDAETGKEVRRLWKDYNGVAAALFTPDGASVLSYHERGGLWLHPVDGTSPPRRAAPPLDEEINAHFCQAISADGALLAAGGYDARVKLCDVATGKLIRTFEGHRGPVSSVAFTPDGRTVVSTSFENGMRIWEVATARQTRFIDHRGDGVAVSPDGKQLAAAGPRKQGTVLWDLGTGKELRSWDLETRCVAFSPDGRTLAAAGGSTIRLLDLGADGKELKVLTTPGSISAVMFRPDGKMLASAARDIDENYVGVIRAWDLSTGDVRFTLRPR
jgi:WD40 repeat protein